MKLNVSFKDKTVSTIETFVKIDDVECEVDELMELLDRLELMDVSVPCSKLREKLSSLEVIEPSRYKKNYFKRGKNYAVFAEQIQHKYARRQKKARASAS